MTLRDNPAPTAAVRAGSRWGAKIEPLPAPSPTVRGYGVPGVGAPGVVLRGPLELGLLIGKFRPRVCENSHAAA